MANSAAQEAADLAEGSVQSAAQHDIESGERPLTVAENQHSYVSKEFTTNI